MIPFLTLLRGGVFLAIIIDMDIRVASIIYSDRGGLHS
jgi:hypothetical protein